MKNEYFISEKAHNFLMRENNKILSQTEKDLRNIVNDLRRLADNIESSLDKDLEYIIESPTIIYIVDTLLKSSALYKMSKWEIDKIDRLERENDKESE